MKINVIYGTDSGTTRSIAKKIALKLPDATVHHVATASRQDIEACDLLILGSPTYQVGELPDDWEKALPLLSEANLANKRVALFGTGDQMNYPDSFADAIGTLYDKVVERGASVAGQTAPSGYDFNHSTALRDGKFVGLVLDADNQAGKTEARINSWIAQLT